MIVRFSKADIRRSSGAVSMIKALVVERTYGMTLEALNEALRELSQTTVHQGWKASTASLERSSARTSVNSKNAIFGV